VPKNLHLSSRSLDGLPLTKDRGVVVIRSPGVNPIGLTTEQELVSEGVMMQCQYGSSYVTIITKLMGDRNLVDILRPGAHSPGVTFGKVARMFLQPFSA